MIGVACLVFLVVNLTAKEILPNFRLDMTEHGLYSLSESTESFLQHLSEPIRLDLFISKSQLVSIPTMFTFASRVEEVLKTYARKANGMITFRLIEPESFSSEEDLAIRYGLRGIPGPAGESMFFGLVGSNSVDKSEVIPLFIPDREELLEYELIQLLVKLNSRERKKVGIISSLPIHTPQAATAGTQNWAIYQQLTNFFDVEMLDISESAIPDHLDILVLIHPLNYSDELLFEIDQFALSGKSLLVFVDPHSEVLNEAQDLQLLKGLDAVSSDLNVLTKNWGVELDKEKIIGDLSIAARVLDNSKSPPVPVDYPVWMNVQPEQMNSEDVVTTRIGNIYMATVGTLKLNEIEDIELFPLIKTSKRAKLYDRDLILNFENFNTLLENYQPLNKNLVIAARIRGQANSAFPERVPKSNAVEQPIQSGEINAIVIADTDFLSDRFWITTQQILGQIIVSPQASNGELVLNAVNNLANEDALIGIRSRGGNLRPFVRVQEIRQAAEQIYRQEEARLIQELKRIEEFLDDFQSDQPKSQKGTILTSEQQQKIKQIQTSRSDLRIKLREVRRNLDREIRNLKNNMILINTLLAPLIVILLGLFAATYGTRNRDRKLLRKIISSTPLR